MENLKKNYKKLQHTGNENGWDEPIVKLGVTSLTDEQAEELNSHFPSTGTKYEETDEKPYGEAPIEVAVDAPKKDEVKPVIKPNKQGKKAAHQA